MIMTYIIFPSQVYKNHGILAFRIAIAWRRRLATREINGIFAARALASFTAARDVSIAMSPRPSIGLDEVGLS
jgi:hypothetical protein